MKYFRLSFLLFSFAFIVASCQKELSYEAGLGKGTLKKDATGECLPINVNGSYQKDTLLKPIINFVEVQVNASEVGSYSIKTDTINGYSFSGAGIFNVQGVNTVRLIGSGKPLAPGFDMFTVTFDTSICKFNVTVTGAGGSGTASVFTLVGAPTSCTGATQNGNYNTGTPTNISNTVTLTANVTSAGTYTISTGVVNGVSFSGTGNLVQGNGQIITLVANGGTPAVMGTFPYPISNGTSNCSFNVIYSAGVSSAVFTFNCTAATSAGIYQQGTPTTAANTITLPITVASGGSYNITTSNNGITFSGSGVLPAIPAAQSVTLSATINNIPTAAGTFNYTVNGGGGTPCAVSITCSPSSVNNADSIVATIDGAYKTFKIRDSAKLDNTSIPGYSAVGIFGDNNTAGDERFSLVVAKMGTPVTMGAYTVNQGPAVIVLGDYATTTNHFRAVSDSTTQTPGFTITISSITSTRVIGTFFGRLKDNAGSGPGYKTVTNGIFSVKIYP